MNRTLKIASMIALALALTAMGSTLSVAAPNPWPTVISCSFYANDLTAGVSPMGALYHYEYALSFSQSFFDEPLTAFSVANLSNLRFMNAANDHGFANPTWNVDSNNSVLWQKGASVPTGQVVKFSYDSPYPYTDVSITLAGGLPSGGRTLGMVPDLSSLAVLATGLAGVGGICLSRLRRSARR